MTYINKCQDCEATRPVTTSRQYFDRLNARKFGRVITAEVIKSWLTGKINGRDKDSTLIPQLILDLAWFQRYYILEITPDTKRQKRAFLNNLNLWFDTIVSKVPDFNGLPKDVQSRHRSDLKQDLVRMFFMEYDIAKELDKGVFDNNRGSFVYSMFCGYVREMCRYYEYDYEHQVCSPIAEVFMSKWYTRNIRCHRCNEPGHVIKDVLPVPGASSVMVISTLNQQTVL